MKKAVIYIGEKRYVSSGRASEIAGYSKDYIGQLCREGRVAAQMVKRQWWIEERSLLRHAAETVKTNQTSFKVSDFKPALLLPGPTLGLPLAASAGPAMAGFSVSAPVASSEVSRQNPFSPAVSAGPLRKVATYVAIVCLVLAIAVESASIFSKTSSVAVAPAASNANAANALDSVAAMIGSGVQAVSNGFSAIAARMPWASNAANNATGDGDSSTREGMVVVPSQGTTTDERLAQSIQNSFSDPVHVRQYPSNGSGVITPVFKTVQGKDYLYVLVPLKGATSTGGQQ